MDMKKSRASKNVTDLRSGNTMDVLREAMDSDKKKKEFLKKYPDYEKNEAAYDARVKKDKDLTKNKDIYQTDRVQDRPLRDAEYREKVILDGKNPGRSGTRTNRKRNPNDPMPGKFSKNKNGDSDFLPFKTIK